MMILPRTIENSLTYQIQELLIKESEALKIPWLQNNLIDDISKEEAVQILEKVPVSNKFKFKLTMLIGNNPSNVDKVLDFIRQIGKLIKFSAQTEEHTYGYACFDFHVHPEHLKESSIYVIKSKITQMLGFYLGYLPIDFKIEVIAEN